MKSNAGSKGSGAANSLVHNVVNEVPRKSPSSDSDELGRLRALLLGPEQAHLGRLEERLDQLHSKVQVEDLSESLPEAIILRSNRDKQLTAALLPTVEESLQDSVRRDPRPIVDAIFPVIGPAIRKAIANALSEMVQSLNQTLEHSLSFRSLKWRLEALRTGKPFAEVVLLHTLVYRVEQVFLIHSKTGLLLQHVSQSTVVPDADMIAGMLTAIQDFVRDSFDVATEDGINAVNMGELTVWVEQGPLAVLAGVIQGAPPQDLRRVLQETLEAVHLRQRNALDSFDGDSAPFEASRPLLEDCLKMEFQPKQASPLLWLLGLVLLVGVGYLGVWGFSLLRENGRWSEYVNRLNSEPGIVVTSTGKQNGRFFVSGLRDPLAVDPLAILKESDLEPDKVIGRWEPYHALQPQFILPRAGSILAPPRTVKLTLDGEVLSARGSAPHWWIVEARSLARAIPGVVRYNDRMLTDLEQKRLESSKEFVEKQTILFSLSTAELKPGQDGSIEELVAAIRALYSSAGAVGQEVGIEIIGHTDSSGDEGTNLKVSQERARRILALLAAQAPDLSRMTAIGVGSAQPAREELTDQERETNRRVSFKVILR